jgi:hypothetical protein
VVAEHGWIDADELEALTGERRTPDLGSWVVAPMALEATRTAVRERVLDAGRGPKPVASFLGPAAAEAMQAR